MHGKREISCQFTLFLRFHPSSRPPPSCPLPLSFFYSTPKFSVPASLLFSLLFSLPFSFLFHSLSLYTRFPLTNSISALPSLSLHSPFAQSSHFLYSPFLSFSCLFPFSFLPQQYVDYIPQPDAKNRRKCFFWPEKIIGKHFSRYTIASTNKNESINNIDRTSRRHRSDHPETSRHNNLSSEKQPFYEQSTLFNRNHFADRLAPGRICL